MGLLTNTEVESITSTATGSDLVIKNYKDLWAGDVTIATNVINKIKENKAIVNSDTATEEEKAEAQEYLDSTDIAALISSLEADFGTDGAIDWENLTDDEVSELAQNMYDAADYDETVDVEEEYEDEFGETQNRIVTHYYNTGTYYYKVTEDQDKTVSGITNSKGDITIKLLVKVDEDGNYTYYVTSLTTTGDEGEIEYATNDNVAMSGVQFDLGAFYNKSSDMLEIRKSVTGDYEATADDEYAFTVKGADGKYYDVDGIASDEPVYVIVKADDKTKVVNLPQQKYTVTEVDAEGYEVDRTGYLHGDVEAKDVTLDGNGTKSISFVNDYKASGVLEVTKKVTGNYEDAKNDTYQYTSLSWRLFTVGCILLIFS